MPIDAAASVNPCGPTRLSAIRLAKQVLAELMVHWVRVARPREVPFTFQGSYPGMEMVTDDGELNRSLISMPLLSAATNPMGFMADPS